MNPLVPSLLLLVATSLAPAIAAAQVVRGAVVDSATGRPVGDFTAMLIDERGTGVTATLAQPGGRFTLHAPAAGTYRIIVLRIGFRRTQSPPFQLGIGETSEQRIVMPQIATALARIQVTGPQRCEGLPNGGEALATVWEEVRKAVQAVALTGDEKRLSMRVRDYTRDLSLDGDSASAEESSEREGLSAHPYVSPSPESIAAEGYVRRDGAAIWYYAPDAAVLLSDAFVDTHCFHLQRSDAAGDSLIGIAFEPVRRRPPPDIRGVLWVDRRSAELRSLEYEYTALSRAVGDYHFGGEVAFAHVPGDGWIIRQWRVRGPVFRVAQRQRTSAMSLGGRGMGAAMPTTDSALTGSHEAGGEVLVARTHAGAVAWARSYATVRGVVRDSSTNAAIGGATVELLGTPYRHTTDGAGGFHLDSVPPGDFTIAATVRAPTPLTRSSALHIRDGEQSATADLVLPASAAAAADAERERTRMANQCAELRLQREKEIDSAFAVPVAAWTPRGRDSAEVARAVRRSAAVLQAIADTTGRIDLSSARALVRKSSAAYTAALEALAKLEPAVEEPLRGCKLRRVILLPYRVSLP
jgi:hypothetical protein